MHAGVAVLGQGLSCSCAGPVGGGLCWHGQVFRGVAIGLGACWGAGDKGLVFAAGGVGLGGDVCFGRRPAGSRGYPRQQNKRSDRTCQDGIQHSRLMHLMDDETIMVISD